MAVSLASPEPGGWKICPAFGDNQFENIVRFMSGHAPSEIPQADWTKPGTERCVALVYEGVEAVRKIRDVLGPKWKSIGCPRE